MHNKNYTKRYSKEAEDIDEIFLFDSKKSQKKSSIHKNDSDKNLVSLEKSAGNKKLTPSSLQKEARIIDFNTMSAQMAQRNIVQPKTLNFQGAGSQDLKYFEDMNEVIKSFSTRDFIKDSNLLKNIGLSPIEIYLGEYIIDKIEPIYYVLNNSCHPGSFIITNYRFIFRPKSENFYAISRLQPSYFSVPLMFIEKLVKSSDRKNNLIFACIEIITKDYREFLLKFSGELNVSSSPTLTRPHERIYILLISSFLPKFREIYAAQFAFNLKNLDEEHKGWQLYDLKEEFFRQGLDIAYNPMDKEIATLRYVDNQNGRICSTYPFLLVLPAKLTEENLQKTAAFRSRERLPVLTYCYQIKLANNKNSQVLLWRSSQCKTGMTQRSLEDELTLKYLGEKGTDGIGTNPLLKIFDARPYLNAVANKLDGKGYENTSNYKNAELRFLGIHNIQKVRDAFKKLCNACYNPDEEKWFGQIENWLNLLGHILSGAIEIVAAMKKGYNCLIHCSDGWDRTSQLLSLIQIMLDPYFRTMKGFMILIEKEWISFGHQFAFRSGHSKNINDDQKSPIFLQFLDCVHQIMAQFPLSFEFNNAFLVDIAFHLYSCYFGTFLYDTILERTNYQTHERTLSLWSYLLASQEKYLNPFYKDDLYLRELYPVFSIKFLRLWKEFFQRHLMDSKDKYNYEVFTEEVLLKEYSLAMKEKALLRIEINKLKHELEQKNNEIKNNTNNK